MKVLAAYHISPAMLWLAFGDSPSAEQIRQRVKWNHGKAHVFYSPEHKGYVQVQLLVGAIHGFNS